MTHALAAEPGIPIGYLSPVEVEYLHEQAAMDRMTGSELLHWARVGSQLGLRAFDSGEMAKAEIFFELTLHFIRKATRP